jgi:hypothetical protein
MERRSEECAGALEARAVFLPRESEAFGATPYRRHSSLLRSFAPPLLRFFLLYCAPLVNNIAFNV